MFQRPHCFSIMHPAKLSRISTSWRWRDRFKNQWHSKRTWILSLAIQDKWDKQSKAGYSNHQPKRKKLLMKTKMINDKKKVTWNCWNFSPSAVNCKRKFFSVANNCETCSAYTFIWACSWICFSSCCLIFKSESCNSRVFCFSCVSDVQNIRVSSHSPLQQNWLGFQYRKTLNIPGHLKYTFCANCCSERAYWSANCFNLVLNLHMRIPKIIMNNEKAGTTQSVKWRSSWGGTFADEQKFWKFTKKS